MDLMRCRHRLSKLLLRHDVRFDDGAAWTDRHRAWLAHVELGWPAAQATLIDARGAVDALVHRRDQLEREIAALLPGSPWATQVGRLRCLRGIDTLTAVGLCAEIADFERFARAEQLMSYIGLVPSEATTGEKRRLGAITKTGSGHARRLLVEASWHYRKQPAIGRKLSDRQDGQPAQAVAIAWSAQRRLTAPGRDWSSAANDARSSPSPPRASSPASAGRSVASSEAPPHTDKHITSAGSVAARQRAGNPRFAYEQPAPGSRGWPRPFLDSGTPRRTNGPAVANPRISA